MLAWAFPRSQQRVVLRHERQILQVATIHLVELTCLNQFLLGILPDGVREAATRLRPALVHDH